MGKIRVMDEILANKIAAGEVVERCASVVKELVENSIDAKSTEIKIELKEAGVSLIKVIDNGIGMDKDDAVVAFSRHATSKLLDEDDLYRINTLGFRGEALASIASVSNVNLYTSQGEVGTHVNIKGGKIINVEPTDSRVGTSIEITELFYNTPARLKHLKSLYTELASITEYVNKIALSNPDIRFTLINNDNIILKTDGMGSLLKTIGSIYGIDVAKKMYDVETSSSDYEISGYISEPSVNRSGRNHMITLVNGRVVRNVEINKTINDAYHLFKPDNRYPIVVLNIEVDPSLVDVNIHPTKMDIKFSKMEELQDLIFNMIKQKLSKQSLVREAIIKDEMFVNTFDDEKIDDENDIKVEPIIDYDKYGKEEVIEKKETRKYEELTLDLERVKEDETVYEVEPEKRLPEMYPIGLIHGTFIVCQNELGMYLIDEHAAKERINYEIFKEKMENVAHESCQLLIPITMELSNTEYIIIKENMEYLINMGFIIEEFGINSIVIKAHPIWFKHGLEDLLTRKVIEMVINKEKNFTLDKFNDLLCATLACKSSIRANTNMSIEEMEHLISDLRKCKNPFNCAHGRPSVIFYSKYELEKMFKRTGFESIK